MFILRGADDQENGRLALKGSHMGPLLCDECEKKVKGLPEQKDDLLKKGMSRFGRQKRNRILFIENDLQPRLDLQQLPVVLMTRQGND